MPEKNKGTIMNKNNTLLDNPWSSQSIQETTQHFQTNLETGLNSNVAEKRLHEYGFNETTARDIGIFTIIFHQLNSPFIYWKTGYRNSRFLRGCSGMGQSQKHY